MGTLIVISGNGTGAGKTTLAKKFMGAVRSSLASALRMHLCGLYPGYEHLILASDPASKTATLPDGRTVREALIEEGEAARSYDELTWCHKWASWAGEVTYMEDIVVDDLRRVNELIYLRRWAADHGRELLHLHIHHDGAKAEPFDDLSEHADYIVRRGKHAGGT